MASATRSRASSSALGGLVGRALLQQAKLLIEKAIQEIELNMNRELNMMTIEQIALRTDVKVINDGFISWLTGEEKGLKFGRIPVVQAVSNQIEVMGSSTT